MRSAGKPSVEDVLSKRGLSMARVVAFLSTFCLLFLLIASRWRMSVFSCPVGRLFHRTLDAPALVKEVRQMNQLVTVKYSMQKVVGLTEARPPLGSESDSAVGGGAGSGRGGFERVDAIRRDDAGAR